MATSFILEIAIILWILSDGCSLSKSLFYGLRLSPCAVFLAVAFWGGEIGKGSEFLPQPSGTALLTVPDPYSMLVAYFHLSHFQKEIILP